MKKVFLFAALAAILSSCNSSQKVTAYFTEHCPESKVTKLYDGSYRVLVKCENLYDTTEIKKYVTNGRVEYNFSGASVSGIIISKDSIPNVYTIFSKISKGIKRK